MTEFADWTEPQANATAISTTGVPLLRGEQAITSGTTAAIAAGGSVVITGAPFTLLTPSYDLILTLTAAAAATLNVGQIKLTWKNAAGTVTLAQKSFTVVASTGGHQITISGPVRGASLSVTLANSSSSGSTITFAYTIVASARLHANDLCRTTTTVGTGPPTLATWANTANMDFGVLASAQAVSLGIGLTTNRGLCMYNGPCAIQAQTAGANNTLEIQVITFDNTVALNQQIIADFFSDSHGLINQQFGLPQLECYLALVNHDTVARTVNFLATTQEPNVN